MRHSNGPENLKKCKQKNSCNKINHFFRELAILAVLNFFPVQILIFEIAKNGIWSKKIREIDLFDFEANSAFSCQNLLLSAF